MCDNQKSSNAWDGNKHKLTETKDLLPSLNNVHACAQITSWSLNIFFSTPLQEQGW